MRIAGLFVFFYSVLSTRSQYMVFIPPTSPLCLVISFIIVVDCSKTILSLCPSLDLFLSLCAPLSQLSLWDAFLISRSLFSHKPLIHCHSHSQFSHTNHDDLQCWESFVGQYAYSLLVIDFLLEALDALCTPPVVHWLHTWKSGWFPEVRPAGPTYNPVAG